MFFSFIVRTRDTRGTIEYTAVIPAKASAHQWRTVQLSWDEFRPSYKAGMIAGIEVRRHVFGRPQGKLQILSLYQPQPPDLLSPLCPQTCCMIARVRRIPATLD